MKAEDVFQDAICAAVEDMIPCQAVWWKDVKASRPPCFLWRIYETDFNEMLDGPEPETRYFEVESRAPTFGIDEFEKDCDEDEGTPRSILGWPWNCVSRPRVLPHEGVKEARRNAGRIIDYLQCKGLLTHIMASFDERLDASMISARSLDDYFSHVIIVGMAAEVSGEVAKEIRDEFTSYRSFRLAKTLIPRVPRLDEEGNPVKNEHGDVLEDYLIVRIPALVVDPVSGKRVVGNGEFTGTRSQIQTVRVLTVQGQVVGLRSTVQVLGVLSVRGEELTGTSADIDVIRVLDVRRDGEFLGTRSQIMDRTVYVDLYIQRDEVLEGRGGVIEKAPQSVIYGPVVLDIEG